MAYVCGTVPRDESTLPSTLAEALNTSRQALRQDPSDQAESQEDRGRLRRGVLLYTFVRAYRKRSFAFHSSGAAAYSALISIVGDLPHEVQLSDLSSTRFGRQRLFRRSM